MNARKPLVQKGINREIESLLIRNSSSIQELNDNVPAVLYEFVVDTSGGWHFTFLSKQIEQIYGIPAEEAYADHNALTLRIIPEDRESHRLSVMHAVTTLSNWSHLHRIRTAKGKLKWIQAQATFKALPSGDVKWFGVLTDVTYYIESKQSIFQLIQTYEKRLQARRLFIEDELAELEFLRIKVLGNSDLNYNDRMGNSSDQTFPVLARQPGIIGGESLLSSRENEILQLIGAGKTTREIAKIIGITISTISVHRKNIRRKLGFKTTTDVIRYAFLKFS